MVFFIFNYYLKEVSRTKKPFMAQDIARKILMIMDGKMSLEEIQIYQKKLDLDNKPLNKSNVESSPRPIIVYDDGKLIKYSDGTIGVIAITHPFTIEDNWSKSK
jgi:hypothetical protein